MKCRKETDGDDYEIVRSFREQIPTVDRHYSLRDNACLLIAGKPVGQNGSVPDIDRETGFPQSQIKSDSFNGSADRRPGKQKREARLFMLKI